MCNLLIYLLLITDGIKYQVRHNQQRQKWSRQLVVPMFSNAYIGTNNVYLEKSEQINTNFKFKGFLKSLLPSAFYYYCIWKALQFSCDWPSKEICKFEVLFFWISINETTIPFLRVSCHSRLLRVSS